MTRCATHSNATPSATLVIVGPAPMAAIASGMSSTVEISTMMPTENPMPAVIARRFSRSCNASAIPTAVVTHDSRDNNNTAVQAGIRRHGSRLQCDLDQQHERRPYNEDGKVNNVGAKIGMRLDLGNEVGRRNIDKVAGRERHQERHVEAK